MSSDQAYSLYQVPTYSKVQQQPHFDVERAHLGQVHLDRLRPPPQPLPAKPSVTEDDAALLRLAREILRFRRARDAIFNGQMFGEPAWDMLLELIAAELAQQKLSVSGLCVSSGVPSTTALRWLSNLEAGGWVTREADASDGRRYWVQLTPTASQTIRAYLATCRVKSC